MLDFPCPLHATQSRGECMPCGAEVSFPGKHLGTLPERGLSDRPQETEAQRDQMS